MKNGKILQIFLSEIVSVLSLFFFFFLFPGVSHANPSMAENIQDNSSGCYKSGENFYLYKGYSGCYVMIATYWSGWETDPGYILNVNDARILTLPPVSPGVGPGNGAAYWVYIPYGSAKFQMRTYYSGTELLTHNRNVYCASGLSWNGSVCVVPRVDGKCATPNASENPPTTTTGCASGTIVEVAYNSNTGQWNWKCSGKGGGNPSGPCVSKAIPKIDFGVATNGMAYSPEVSAVEGENVSFEWSAIHADSCDMISGFNSSTLFPDDSYDPNKTMGPFKAFTQVKWVYTLQCKNKAEKNSKEVRINVSCTPVTKPWSECDPNCDQSGWGKKYRYRKDADCAEHNDEESCSVPQCQPDGLREVKP